MTSINAMKFNRNMGACLHDEERGWDEEGLVSLTTEKMRLVTNETLRDEQRAAVIYGNTGTSTIGEELRVRIRDRITGLYRKAREKAGKAPEGFMTVEGMAQEAFDVITQMKHNHLDQELKGRYGFTTLDYVQGYYERGGEKIDIKQKEMLGALDELCTWTARSKAPMALHLNAGIIAGYEPQEGFRLFGLSMISPAVEPVQEIFLADGSGRDMCTVVFTEDANRRSLPERRGDIDPVEGMLTMLDALNTSFTHNIGVGGYPCLIVVDGGQKNPADIVWHVQDHSGKLAAEITAAERSGFLDHDAAGGLVERLIFGREAFEAVEEDLWKAARRPKKLLRFLRGYKNP
jgi:hypothetical protein